MHPWARVNGLGKISSPLAVVDLEGRTKVVVAPWAAIGTDVLGMGLATILFFSTSKTWVKVVAALGGTWMFTALFVETMKLLSAPESIETV